MSALLSSLGEIWMSFKTCCPQHGLQLGDLRRPGNAPGMKGDVAPDMFRQFGGGDDIGDGESAAWFQNAKCFNKDP